MWIAIPQVDNCLQGDKFLQVANSVKAVKFLQQTIYIHTDEQMNI